MNIHEMIMHCVMTSITFDPDLGLINYTEIQQLPFFILETNG